MPAATADVAGMLSTQHAREKLENQCCFLKLIIIEYEIFSSTGSCFSG